MYSVYYYDSKILALRWFSFFADIGYNINVFLDNQSRIMSYISRYYGVVENFHRYHFITVIKRYLETNIRYIFLNVYVRVLLV